MKKQIFLIAIFIQAFMLMCVPMFVSAVGAGGSTGESTGGSAGGGAGVVRSAAMYDLAQSAPLSADFAQEAHFSAVYGSAPGGFLSVNSTQEAVSQTFDDFSQEALSPVAPADLHGLQSASGEQLDLWAKELPKFDGRNYGYVTSEKNQYDKNICWAYAAVGAAEASILREGIDPSATQANLNLDEYVAAYLRFNRDGKNDPLQLTVNDSFGGEWNRGDFAHNVFAVMSQGFSPVLQKTNYYSTDEQIKSFVSESEYFVQDYIRIGKSPEAIKRAILQYGAVTIEYRAPDTFKNYYYTANGESTNHASIIVGWDDSVEKNLFSPSKPSANGAWIVKNSWGYNSGTDPNNTGVRCFYLSYDSYLTSNCYAVDLAMKEDYQNLYFYDGQIETSGTNYSADAQAAIYEAKLSSASEKERLKAVTVVCNQGELDATVKVYRHLNVNPGNVNDAINVPEQGDPVSERHVRLERIGHYTIDLDAPVELEQGEYFSVVVSCKSQFGSSVPLPCAVESSESVNDMTYFQYNGKWTSYKGDETTYADAGSRNLTARIRAVTDTVPREEALGNDLRYARVEIPNRLLYYAQGKALTPEVRVYFGGEQLTEGRDFTVTLVGNTVPGMATVRIDGMGNYFGTRTTSFEVAKPKTPPNVMPRTVTVYNNTTRLHQIPIPVDWEWIDGDCDLQPGRSYFAYSLRYVGADKDFYRTTTCDFYVEKVDADPPEKTDLSDAEASVVGTYTYTGSPIVPAVTVVCKGLKLHEGVDFVVTCRNNTDAGQAIATVTGKGAYSGQLTLFFAIGRAERTGFSVFQEGWTYGESALPRPTLAGEGEPAAVTYLYAETEQGPYSEALPANAGRYWIKAVIAQSQNYNAAESTAPFSIAPADLGSFTLTVEGEDFVCSGQAFEPRVVVSDGKITLTEADYSVFYENNVDAGVATVTVRGRGNYTGTLTATFEILPEHTEPAPPADEQPPEENNLIWLAFVAPVTLAALAVGIGFAVIKFRKPR